MLDKCLLLCLVSLSKKISPRSISVALVREPESAGGAAHVPLTSLQRPREAKSWFRAALLRVRCPPSTWLPFPVKFSAR